MTHRCVSGTRPQKVGEGAQTLLGVAPSASAVSRLNQSLTEHYEAWRVRSLLTHSRIVYLDGIPVRVRHGDTVASTSIGTALAGDREGNKEVLAVRACAQEDKDGWKCRLQDRRTWGGARIDLIVTDGQDGLLAAVTALFPAPPRQRCLVQTQRTVLNAIPHCERQEVATERGAIGKQDTKEDAQLHLNAFKATYQERSPEAIRSVREEEEHLLTCSAFPPVMPRSIRSTHAMASFFRHVRQRTDQMDAFSTETSGLTSGWAALQAIHVPRLPVSYLERREHFYTRRVKQANKL